MWSKEFKNSKEKKSFLSFDFELKQFSEDDEYFRIEGYGSAFSNVDRGKDIVAPGAMSDSIKEFMPSFLWMHKDDTPIGKIDAASEDSNGLFVKTRLPKDDTLVKGRVIPQVKTGSVAWMSIGYYPTEYHEDDDGNRVITKMVLFEISLVHLPMNPKAKITSSKTFDIDAVKEIKTKRDFEKALRDSGAFSQKAALFLTSFFSVPDSSDSKDGELKELLAVLDDGIAATKKLRIN